MNTAPVNTASDNVAEELERVFNLQNKNKWNVKASDAEARKAKLAKLKSAVEAHADEIVAAVQTDTRKPEAEVRVTEVYGVMGNIQFNIDGLDDWMTPKMVQPSSNPDDTAKIVYEARGVCLILGPWNFPLGLTFGPLAAAIAAGNCCMVKLTDLCPATAAVAGKIIRSVFDESEVALFEGDVSVAESLLELPFDHIFFTGSTRVGKLVMAAAAKHLSTVTLELGGKSPVIVDETTNIDKVAADLARGKQFNGGQACISPDYVLVKDAQKDALAQSFDAHVKSNLYADGELQKDNIAQIVNDPNFERVKGMLDDAVEKGAAISVGGNIDAADRTVPPTMVTDVTPEMKIMQDEIFAPVLPVMTYDTMDDVISYISSRDKPLALYIYSDEQDTVEKVLSRTSSGGVTVNGVFSHYLENRLPFGGVNQSGMGKYHGFFGFRAFSHERAVYMHPPA